MALVTFSLLARKGGVGRTTTTLNLAGLWVKEGARVLCFDLDSQASLSRCLLGSDAVESRHASATIAGLFDTRYEPEPEELICSTQFEKLCIVPAHDALEDFNVTKPGHTGESQFVIREFLDEVKGDFDVALIDTGPNTCGLSAWASLAASHFVLSPVLCDAFGTQSIISVQQLVEKIQTSINPGIEILGYFINMRQKNAVMEGYENTLRKIHGPMIFKTVLPLAAAYRQTVSERTPLALKKTRNKAVVTLAGLAAEIDDRICALVDSKEAA